MKRLPYSVFQQSATSTKSVCLASCISVLYNPAKPYKNMMYKQLYDVVYYVFVFFLGGINLPIAYCLLTIAHSGACVRNLAIDAVRKARSGKYLARYEGGP